MQRDQSKETGTRSHGEKGGRREKTRHKDGRRRRGGVREKAL